MDNGFILSVDGDGVCDLDDGVFFGFGEVSFAALAFNVHGEDSKGCDFVPFSFGLVCFDVVVGYIDFQLLLLLLLLLLM